MKHDGAHSIINGANSALDLAILLRHVGTRKTKQGATRVEKCVNRGVDKLGAIVRLERANSGAELSTSIGEKIHKGDGCIRFVAQRKRPIIMREVIDDHKIISKTRITNNWRCPQITVN